MRRTQLSIERRQTAERPVFTGTITLVVVFKMLFHIDYFLRETVASAAPVRTAATTYGHATPA